MSAATPRSLRAAEGVGLATLLLASAACGPASSPYREASGDDGVRWAVVQMYLDQQEAWETEAGDVREILFGGGAGSLDEKVRRMEEAHGELPDATSAIAAAREIVAAGGRYTVEAAEFLIERDRGPLGMLNRERRLEEAAAEVGSAEAVETLGAADDRTWEALTAHLGPDWVNPDLFDHGVRLGHRPLSFREEFRRNIATTPPPRSIIIKLEISILTSQYAEI